MEQNGTLNAEVLAQILLVESMIVHLPDEQTIFDFVSRGLELVPGVISVKHTSQMKQDWAIDGVIEVPLKMEESHYGSLCFQLSNHHLFKQYLPYINNLCQMLALIIDQRQQRDEIIDAKLHLEQRVEHRTLQLKDEIQERQQAEKLAITHQQRAERYLEISEAIIIELDKPGCIQVINQRGCDILGYSEAEIIGREWMSLALPESKQHQIREVFENITVRDMKSYAHYENEIITRSGETRIIVWHNVQVLDHQGECIGTVSSGHDVTERKLAEERAHHLAFYDELTGLPNRRLMQDRLKQSIANSARTHTKKALLFLDLDNFKDLNDNLGHHQGDQMLVETAQRIRLCLREIDTVSRYGGDEFIVLLGQLGTNTQSAANNAGAVAEKIIQKLNLPYMLDEHIYQSSVSIGIVLFQDQLPTVAELLKRADMAMYQSKAAGKNSYHFFDPIMQESIAIRRELVTDLRAALKNDEFKLYYQPQIGSEGRCIGVEALIRWISPTRGLVSPMEFIPLAEETRLIIPIGRWVLEQACKQLKIWQNSIGSRELRLSINVSAVQFHHESFVEDALELVSRNNIDPTGLQIEITESLLVTDIDSIVEKINHLKKISISFALDDFGTGYSSLSYLKRLPIEQLKIDRSFVNDILTDPNDAAICRAIIAMGQTLGLSIIAEGVEESAQWEILKLAGCHEVQGFLFARPMALKDFMMWFGCHNYGSILEKDKVLV
jgi:diguanylate cyclase (GGDEF)-like protein/PAS domain S-box-containing protein